MKMTDEEREMRKARREAALERAKVAWPVGTVAKAEGDDIYLGRVTGYEFDNYGTVLVILDGYGKNGNEGGWCAYVSELSAASLREG